MQKHAVLCICYLQCGKSVWNVNCQIFFRTMGLIFSEPGVEWKTSCYCAFQTTHHNKDPRWNWKTMIKNGISTNNVGFCAKRFLSLRVREDRKRIPRFQIKACVPQRANWPTNICKSRKTFWMRPLCKRWWCQFYFAPEIRLQLSFPNESIREVQSKWHFLSRPDFRRSAVCSVLSDLNLQIHEICPWSRLTQQGK